MSNLLKPEEIVVKIWDMSQASVQSDNPSVVRQATLEWALLEIAKTRKVVVEETKRELEEGHFIPKYNNPYLEAFWKERIE